jgi:Hemerythrin HHE cation binding domain
MQLGPDFLFSCTEMVLARCYGQGRSERWIIPLRRRDQRGDEEEAMPDVFEVLGAAHRELEQMLDRMQYLIGGAAEPTAELREQGGSLAAAMISAVSQHEAAEEEYFWPAVKEKVADRDSLAADGIEQETEAKKLLAELDGMAPGNPRFIPLITQFNHAARAHIAYEERRVWPDLRAALSPSEAGQLGERIARATKAGHTRPHPHTPPSPAC